VCNLQQFNREVSHNAFTSAVVDEFREEFGIESPAQYIEATDDLQNIDYIRRGLDELPSWDWAYGQTPEFTYTIDETFSWGEVQAKIRSKHGIILACMLEVRNTQLEAPAIQELTILGNIFEGKRYGFMKDVPGELEKSGPRKDILTWIQKVAAM